MFDTCLAHGTDSINLTEHLGDFSEADVSSAQDCVF